MGNTHKKSHRLTVLVTRPPGQADELCYMLEAAGVRAVHLPLMEIDACGLDAGVLERSAQDKSYDWLIFISANAVQYGAGMVALLAGHGSNPACAAIGKATAHKLDSMGIAVDLLPEEPAGSEMLLACAQFENAAGLKCLIIRGEGGRELLADELRNRGATVDYLEVYRRVPIVINPQRFIELSRQDKVDIVTVTSGENLGHLTRQLPADMREAWLKKPIIVMGERMKQQALALGYDTVVSTGANNQAIVDAVTALGRNRFQF
ncbi:uroporphyrinogen-III synthase [Candidatus Methylospira mobilis]|uniref:Uroporphyrinogen-III synthase n=1 Tax=Candidatus Methylospira mobilis TaxID=1808979 RepID=A0A5Q0BQW4_9GAMM|nr:uroporphyrinogen-III synthase [Candidatus Methylospira mobilis]QFY44691.1 uroporphyrinogen-III synthase [Candidatus Methylospira mobilis]